jgi:hypothetical protein
MTANQGCEFSRKIIFDSVHFEFVGRICSLTKCYCSYWWKMDVILTCPDRINLANKEEKPKRE